MMEEKIRVRIDKDLEDLIPGYLQNRRKDIDAIEEALNRGDYEAVRVLGHSMKGSGGGYGFDAVTDIGRKIEDAAKIGDARAIRSGREELAGYLEKIEVTYE